MTQVLPPSQFFQLTPGLAYDSCEFIPSSKLWSNGQESQVPDRASLPIPKGCSAYAKAKKAEYVEKNLEKAEKLYKLSITKGERIESAVKDLAGLLHQRGNTEEACSILEKYKTRFVRDKSRYENLIQSFKRQLVPTGNSLNKTLRISNLPSHAGVYFVEQLFKNSSRIQDTQIYSEEGSYFAKVGFISHSAARKTLEGYHRWEEYKVEWVNVKGEVVGDANYTKGKSKFSSFFSCAAGKEEQSEDLVSYKYFPTNSPPATDADPVDALLGISISSYFRDGQ